MSRFSVALRLLTCRPLGRPPLPAARVGVLALVEPAGRPRFLTPADGILAGRFRREGRPGLGDSRFAGRPRCFAGEAAGAVLVCGVVELLGGLPRPRLDGVAVAVMDLLDGVPLLLGGLPRPLLAGASAFWAGIELL